jgi:hypothetical protein
MKKKKIKVINYKWYKKENGEPDVEKIAKGMAVQIVDALGGKDGGFEIKSKSQAKRIAIQKGEDDNATI